MTRKSGVIVVAWWDYSCTSFSKHAIITVLHACKLGLTNSKNISGMTPIKSHATGAQWMRQKFVALKSNHPMMWSYRSCKTSPTSNEHRQNTDRTIFNSISFISVYGLTSAALTGSFESWPTDALVRIALWNTVGVWIASRIPAGIGTCVKHGGQCSNWKMQLSQWFLRLSKFGVHEIALLLDFSLTWWLCWNFTRNTRHTYLWCIPTCSGYNFVRLRESDDLLSAGVDDEVSRDTNSDDVIRQGAIRAFGILNSLVQCESIVVGVGPEIVSHEWLQDAWS